ncbi:OmpA family protein [Oceanimonas baumannii]|uniref:OmpA/MotB family protein n=1 Tax=Oceanimonas baumannii TaxID=129578 RepID=UPI001D18C6B9|nr:OmpA family protein [Oceanimonas baumannii]MCC4264123.1 OmpA family protein [Oceanimonas baumannii]
MSANEKQSEWIAISDLMAGVMAVVMLLLVVAVLQKNINEMSYKEQLDEAESKIQDPIREMTNTLSSVIRESSSEELITLDTITNRLTLKDSVFERGSACLKPDARNAIESIREQVVNFISENPRARILVEGYTDNIPVKRPVTDHQRFCTVYDDNFTLSAARAREARKALIGSTSESTARRIVVAGYGDSRPLPGISPESSQNRRVEVQFIIE